MKLLSILIVSILFLSCDKDKDGIIDGPDVFCWECTFKSTAIMNGQTGTSSIKSDLCNMNVVQIRKFEQDNSKTTVHGNGVKSTVKVTCVKK